MLVGISIGEPANRRLGQVGKRVELGADPVGPGNAISGLFDALRNVEDEGEVVFIRDRGQVEDYVSSKIGQVVVLGFLVQIILRRIVGMVGQK